MCAVEKLNISVYLQALLAAETYLAGGGGGGNMCVMLTLL